MAKTVGIFGESGDGKTTSIAINLDGKFDYSNYTGMDPGSTVIIESDGKDLPFPAIIDNNRAWVNNKNLFYESDHTKVKSLLKFANSAPQIKAIFIDTINGIMTDKEMNDITKKSYDKWADLAQNIYELINFCNKELRPDMIVYLGGHVGLYTNTDNEESKCLITNGRKLEKIKLETKLPIVLFTKVTSGGLGKNNHQFETQKNRSTAKTPIGMFKDFLIPNSLSLVDTTIRKYYGI